MMTTALLSVWKVLWQVCRCEDSFVVHDDNLGGPAIAALLGKTRPPSNKSESEVARDAAKFMDGGHVQNRHDKFMKAVADTENVKKVAAKYAGIANAGSEEYTDGAESLGPCDTCDVKVTPSKTHILRQKFVVARAETEMEKRRLEAMEHGVDI